MPAKKAEKQRVSSGKKPRGRGKPFTKGKSGNPKGRPPLGKSLAEAVRKIGKETIDRGKYKGHTRLEALIRSLYQQGIKGNARAAALITERGWGKPMQPVGDETGGPISIRIIEE